MIVVMFGNEVFKIKSWVKNEERSNNYQHENTFIPLFGIKTSSSPLKVYLQLLNLNLFRNRFSRLL